MTDEPPKVLDLDIDGSTVKITLDEARALLVTLQDIVAAAESDSEQVSGRNLDEYMNG